MKKETSIKLFEEKKVRTIWDEEKEEWYFSVVDVVGVNCPYCFARTDGGFHFGSFTKQWRWFVKRL